MSAIVEHVAGALAERGPFSLEYTQAYRRWREEKLRGYPSTIDALLVEVRDARNLSPA